MFVLPIVHDLLAKTDEERAMARDLMCSNIDYIVDNGFTLVDADGNVTTWGHWCVCFPPFTHVFYDLGHAGSLKKST